MSSWMIRRRVFVMGQGPADGGDRAGLVPHVEEEVGFGHDLVGVVSIAVVAHHAYGERVGLGDRALAGDARAHWGVQEFGQFGQFVPGARVDGAAPGYDHRPLGRHQELGRPVHLGSFAAHPERGIEAAGVFRVDVRLAAGYLRVQHLLRERDVHRSRPPRRGHAEGAAQGVRDLVVPLHEGGPFGDGLVEHVVVQFGDDALVLGGQIDPGRQGDHGDGGGVGLGHAGHRVERARAGRAFAHRGAAGEAGVGVGHEGGRTLVARHDVGDDVAPLVERIVQPDAGVSRDAEHVLDPVGHQHLHYDVTSAHRLSPRERSPRSYAGWAAPHSSLKWIPMPSSSASIGS